MNEKLAHSKPDQAGNESKSTCAECAALTAEVEELRVSRDDALLALAKERELLEALRSKYSAAEIFLRTGREAPLRYLIADKLNNVFKERLEILHVAAKRATALVVRLTKSKS